MQRDGQTLWADLCARPDESTFGPIYDAYKPLVWTICRRMLGGDEDAGDAFQSAWARLFAHAKAEGMRAAAEPIERLIYVFSIREADALKKRRMRRGRREIAMDELPIVASPDVPADEAAAAAERRARLETVVAMLPEKYRLPIQLHYFHGLTQQQIAAMMDMPRATVASRLARGLRKLTPLAARAGLGEAVGMMGALAIGGALISPPKALAAAAVYAQVQAMLAAGVTTAGMATSAAATKAMLGASILKAKLALVCGSIMLAAAATVAGVYCQTRHPANQSPMPKQTVQAARADAVAVSSPPTTQSPSASPNSAKAASLATPAPSPAPTPVPTPAGPTRKIQFAVVWADTMRPAEATTVSLQGISSKEAVSGRTDARGRLTIEIPEKWVIVNARAGNPDSVCERESFDMRTARQPLMMKLRRGGRIYGTVITTDYRPVAGATVICKSRAWGYVDGIAGADGSFEICSVPAGAAALFAKFQEMRSDVRQPEGEEIKAVAGRRVGPVSLVLEPGSTVTGQVSVARGGAAVGGAEIRILNETEFEDMKIATDPAGRYTIRGLPAKELMLCAKAGEYAVERRMVTPRAGVESRCDFALRPGGVMDVLALNAAGVPIESADIGLAGNLSFAFSHMSIRTGSDGRATLRNLPTDGAIHVSAMKEELGSGSRAVAFKPGELKTSVTLTIAPQKIEKGYIEGTVTDSDGNPLAGINLFHGFYDNPDEYSARAKTDAAGQYRIESGAGGWQLAAYGEGWGTEIKMNVWAGPKDQPTRMNFVLKPGHWLAGVVVNERGMPLPGVGIRLGTQSPFGWLPPPAWDMKTDAAGRFRAENLPDYDIQIDLYGEGIPDQTERSRVDKEIKIVIKPRGAIRGRVLDKATGKPIENFAIKAMGSGLSVDFRTAGKAFTNPEGGFEIDSLRTGETYLLEIQSKGYAAHREKEVVAAAAGSNRELTISLDKGKTIRGVLVDAVTNEPIAGARLAYGMLREGAQQWQIVTRPEVFAYEKLVRCATGADGRFEFDGEDDRQTLYIVPEEHQRVVVTASERARFEHDGEHVIPLRRGGEIAGRVTIGGKPEPKASVYLCRETNTNQSLDYGSVQCDEEGRYRIAGLEAGSYSFSALNRQLGPGGMGYYVYQRRVQLGDNEKTQIDFGADFGDSILAGAVIHNGVPVPFAWIHLTPLFETDYIEIDGNSDDNGIFTIDGLKPGKYRADVSKPNQNASDRLRIGETIEVRAGTTRHDFEEE
ncbi:MAG: sigma-70 family RNA polymerase sigma factor [Candidatus Sumerlaeia bacterium]